MTLVQVLYPFTVEEHTQKLTPLFRSPIVGSGIFGELLQHSRLSSDPFRPLVR
jgi:hypothetical protein